ncbi:hypothetical protein LIS82_15110 [Cytobacillus solani]|uniref:DUF6944 family repetitive protein n=1 Tax=Cytobacillus solani TaxID=1637975 RepID=UPI00207947E0|nr:hypothetical protein [Cytobacillus solani]USK52955.1 hypothetical protein LIS82_15110 [Cytobacillus solani]
MNKEMELLLTGTGFLVAGTFFSAVGATKVFVTREDDGLAYVVKGNTIESIRNSLQAIAREKLLEDREANEKELLAIIGCWFQAGGIAANAIAYEMILNRVEEKAGFQLNAIGSGIQAVGGSFEAYGVQDEGKGVVLGAALISLGSLFDAISNLYILREKEDTGNAIAMAGTYIEFTGSLVALAALTQLIQAEAAEKETKRYQYSHSSICLSDS